jgi:hypothetical protein
VPHPFYTPTGTFGSDYVLEPVAYGLKFAGSFSGRILLKTDFSTKLQDAGVNATAYAAKLPGGHTSVIILDKDAAADLEGGTRLWSRRQRSGANRDITRTGTRQPRSAHHIVNEDGLAQAGQVLRYCSPCDGITCDTELSRFRSGQGVRETGYLLRWPGLVSSPSRQ